MDTLWCNMNDAVHLINGQLIDVLRNVLPRKLQLMWKHWIVNVAVLSEADGPELTLALTTSATLHFAEKFYTSADCGRDTAVSALDRHIPLDCSYGGYCARTGHIVWINDFKTVDDTFASLYRGFGYVGVTTEPAPRAEYIFPIMAPSAASQIVAGILNFEWYPPNDLRDGPSPWVGQHGSITLRLSKLLPVHASFLVLMSALSLNAPGCTLAPLVRLHKRALKAAATAFLKPFNARPVNRQP